MSGLSPKRIRFSAVLLMGLLCVVPIRDEARADGSGRFIVSIERGRLTINRKRVRFPLRLDGLRGALGRESRVVSTLFLKVYIWDSLGVSAVGLGDARGSVDSLKILLGSPHPRAAKRSPRAAFPGRFMWNGRRVDARTDAAGLRRAMRGRRLETKGSQNLVRFSEMTLNIISAGKILLNEIEIEAARSR